jgi:hypothetical protein
MLVKKLKGRKSVFDIEFDQVGSKVTMKKSCQLQRTDDLLKNNGKQTVVRLVILVVAHQYILLPIGCQQQVELDYWRWRLSFLLFATISCVPAAQVYRAVGT